MVGGRAAGILAAGHALGAQSLWFCELGLHLLCINSFALGGSPDNNKHLSCLAGRALLAHAGGAPWNRRLDGFHSRSGGSGADQTTVEQGRSCDRLVATARCFHGSMVHCIGHAGA